MRTIMSMAVCTLLFAVVAMGCTGYGQGLTDDQQRRVKELELVNKALLEKVEALTVRVKDGTATAGEVADVIAQVTDTVKTNAKEIEKIRAEGGGTTAAFWGALGGAFGRSALHVIKAVIPTTIPGGPLLSGFLTLLLGGSGTLKPKDPTASPTSTP